MGAHAPPPTGGQVLGFMWSMTFFTLILVIIRTYVRIYQPKVRDHLPRRPWRAFDFLVMFAWVFFCAQSLIATLLNQIGFFEPGVAASQTAHDQGILEVEALKLYYTSNALYLFCMYCIKCAMLLFFKEFIPKFMKKTFVAWCIAAALVVLSWIIGTSMLLFWCLPVSRNWSLNDEDYCAADDQPAVVGFTIGFHLLTDMIIYCLPWPVLISLSLPRRQKVGIGITFALGFLCVFFAVALLVASYLEGSWAVIYIFATFEQTWAVVVACCPAFKEILASGEVKKGWSRVSGFMVASPRNGSRNGSVDANNSAPGSRGNNGIGEARVPTPDKLGVSPPIVRVECRRSVEVRVETQDGVKVSLPTTATATPTASPSNGLQVPISVPVIPIRQILQKPNLAFIREAKTRDEPEGKSWANLDSRSTTEKDVDVDTVSLAASTIKDTVSINMPIQHVEVDIPPIPEMPAAYLNAARSSRLVTPKTSKARSIFRGFGHRKRSSQDSSDSSRESRNSGSKNSSHNRTSWLHCNPSVERLELTEPRKPSDASNYTTKSWLDPHKASKASSDGSWLDV